MNIEDLKKLSPQEALGAAAKFAGVDASVLDGMWNAESARGTLMRSPAGAEGHFGLMPKTRALFEKKLGVTVNPNDFADSLFIAAHHLKEDLTREGGNVVSALRAYNNGPNWRNQKDPRGENAAYAARVLNGKEVGNATVDAPAATAAELPLHTDASTAMPWMQDRTPKTVMGGISATTGFLAGLQIDPQTADLSKGFAATGAESVAKQTEIDNLNLTTAAQAMFWQQGIASSVLKRAIRPEYEPTPGFVPPEDKLVGFTEDEQSFMREAKSLPEFDRYKWEVAQEREDMRVAGLKGGWYAAAAGIVAGFPEGVITGVGVAKTLAVAGLGSHAAMQAGNTGRAIGLSVLENVGGNLAMTAVEDAIGGRMSIFDYAVAGAVGGLFTGLQARGVATEASKARQAALAMRIAEDAANMQAEMAAKAVKNLGAGATTDEIAQEITRLEVAHVKASGVTGGSLPEGRRLLPDMEKLQADEELVQAAQVKEGAGSISELDVKPGELNSWHKLTNEVVVEQSRGSNWASMSSSLWGQSIDDLKAAKPGTYFHSGVSEANKKIVNWVHEKLLPDVKLYFREDGAGGANGDYLRLPHEAAIIRIRPGAETGTIIHELGHAVLVRHFDNAPQKVKDAMAAFHEKWLTRYIGQEAPPAKIEGMPDRFGVALERSLPNRAATLSNPMDKHDASFFDVLARAVDYKGNPITPTKTKEAKRYWGNFDEMSAEQFTKWMETTIRGENSWKPAIIPPELSAWVKDLWTKFTSLFTKAKESGYLNADASFQDFFEFARKQARAVGTKEKRAAQGLNPNRDPKVDIALERAQSLDPTQTATAMKYGLDLLPVSTPAERAEQKALVALYAKAGDATAPWNNIDPKWIDTLTAKSHALGSTGLHMLRSKNPVARMVAAEMLESTTGAGGRRSTAALGKYLAERKYMGNSINEFQDHYKAYRNAKGGGIWNDYVGGEHWANFNRAVAEEMEARRTGAANTSGPAVKGAADVVEKAYERMRIDQIDKKTIGWAALPSSSKGYMPHRLSGEKVRNMTNGEHRAFHSALVDQFVGVEGWDISFSANLAAKYIDRAKVRAMGGHDVPGNVHQVGAADVVKDALEATGLSQPEVQAQMAKFMRGGAGHTKQRLRLDLNQQLDDNGRAFTLMDLFETDQLTLLRNQAGRVSGETALAQHGVMGMAGMKLLRRAMSDFGEDVGKAQPHEVQAFDQVAAEMLNQPFGDYGGKWMNRAMQANSLARLGGMGFTQFAEYINAATHLGAGKAMSAVSSLPRLRAEAAALARGEKVPNPIIGSLEVHGGAEFGTDAYKMVFPFDNPSLQYQVNGHDTVTLADRLLRGGSHAQGKLSFWRAIHGAQTRGVAEQIVHKASKFLRDGGTDKALADMGIDSALAAKLQADLHNIATFDSAGNLSKFDITKATDKEAAAAFVQAVHRGAGQIIQGTFIGETGKWAHSGWLRLLTQFRTFSITSVEKQWARNRNNYGLASAVGMLMGSMSIAAPVYMARQAVYSIGKDDQEAWLEKQLSASKIARATLNYVAASGLAGEFLDAFASVSGMAEATGGRSGGTTKFVGNIVAPAAGLADDLWAAVQNNKDGTDVHELLKNGPFAKLPMLAPVLNLMGN